MRRAAVLALWALGASLASAQEDSACLFELARAAECGAHTASPRVCALARAIEDQDREQALELGRELTEGADSEMAGCVHEALGNLQFYRGELEASLSHFEASLQAFEELGDLREQAYRLKDLGVVYRSLGRFDDALWAFEEVRARDPEWRSEPLAVSLLGNLGSLYARLGAPSHSLAAYREALALAEREDPPRQAHDILARMGVLQVARGAPERGVEALERAVDLAESWADDRTRAWIQGELGGAYSALGERQAAESLLRRSLQSATESGGSFDRMASLIDLGALHVDQDLESAEAFFAEALEVAPSITFGPVWRAHAGLAAIASHRGQRDQSLELYRRALASIETDRKRLLAWQDRGVLDSGTRAVYEDYLFALLARGDVEQAFAVSESARARGFLEELVRSRVEPSVDLPRGLADRRTVLRDRLGALLGALETPIASDEKARLAEELDRTELALAELVETIRKRSPGYASVVFPEPIEPRALYASLPRATAFLAYLTGRGGSAAFLVHEGGLQALRLPWAADEIERRVGIYLELLRRGGEGWLAGSRKLYEELIEPFESELREIDHLVIGGDGALLSLPFETLLDERRTTLLEHAAISYTPSATVLGELLRREATGHRNGAGALIVANPAAAAQRGRFAVTAELFRDEGVEIGRLPAAEHEARSVAALAGSGSRILSSNDATEARFRDLEPARFRILHFATHALVSRRRPERSALLLSASGSDDGFLQAQEIARLTIGADLVVLSACRSARGRDPAGNVHGLARSFLHAGALSVVGSLWEVDDRSTALFMGDFYRRLRRGQGKAEALRGAKLAVLEERGLLSPAAWAPFVLIGEPFGTVPMDGEDRPSRQWLAPAFLILSGLFLAWLSTRPESSR